MGYFIPRDEELELKFKRGILPSDLISKILVNSKILNNKLETILKQSRLSENKKDTYRRRYKITGQGKTLNNARGNFYLKLYSLYKKLKRKRKTRIEKRILSLYSKLITKKEANTSQFSQNTSEF